MRDKYMPDLILVLFGQNWGRKQQILVQQHKLINSVGFLLHINQDSKYICITDFKKFVYNLK